MSAGRGSGAEPGGGRGEGPAPGPGPPPRPGPGPGHRRAASHGGGALSPPRVDLRRLRAGGGAEEVARLAQAVLGRGELGGRGKLEALLQQFQQVQQELGRAEQNLGGAIERLEADVQRHEREKGATMGRTQEMFEQFMQTFEQLDARAARIGQNAAQIGDQLREVDERRTIAEDTIELVRNFEAFSAIDGDFERLPALFRTDAQIIEAARIAQKMVNLAKDLTTVKDSISHTPGLAGVEFQAAPPKPGHRRRNSATGEVLNAAIANIVTYCNELENRILQNFDAAEAKGDQGEMVECVNILTEFNGGTNLVSRYIASRPMFIDEAHLLVLGRHDEGDPDDVMRALNRLYKQALEGLKREVGIIREIFKDSAPVVRTLVGRVLEQCIQTALMQVLELYPSRSARDKRERLNRIVRFFKMTQQLLDGVRSLSGDDFDVQAQLDSLFQVPLLGYPRQELDAVHALYADQFEGREVDGRFATEMVDWFAEAADRCHLFLAGESTSYVVSDLLLSDAAPAPDGDFGLLGCAARHLKDGMERASAAFAEEAAAIARNPGRAAAEFPAAFRGAMGVFREVHAVAAAVRDFVEGYSAREMKTPFLQKRYRDGLERSATKIDNEARRHLDALIGGACEVVEHVLSHHRKEGDFNPAEMDPTEMEKVTDGVAHALPVLQVLHEGAAAALQPGQARYFMDRLGNKLYGSVMAHIAQSVFNPIGALRLKQDVQAYSRELRSWGAEQATNQFEMLSYHLNVLVVPPDSLPSLIESEHQLELELVREVVQLRSDFQSEAKGLLEAVLDFEEEEE